MLKHGTYPYSSNISIPGENIKAQGHTSRWDMSPDIRINFLSLDNTF